MAAINIDLKDAPRLVGRGRALAFSGTRKGMTPRQLSSVIALLGALRPAPTEAKGRPPAQHFHVGAFEGADTQVAPFARRAGFAVDDHGTWQGPIPWLKEGMVMVAAPGNNFGRTAMGGTGLNVVEARRLRLHVITVFPDGSMTLESPGAAD